MPENVTPENQALFASLAAYLDARGLGNLFSVADDGTPQGWLWEKLQEGVDTADELLIAVEETQEFADRFGIILDLRARAASGEVVQVPTVDQVLEYEQSVASVMRRANMPSYLYDTPQAIHGYLGLQLSPVEIEARVDTVWNTVHAAAPEIRQEFNDILGLSSDSMLAAFILDPDNTEIQLERFVRQAQVGGMAEQFGIDITDFDRARIADDPFTLGGIQERLGNISANAGFFDETYGEAVDLTAEKEGIGAEFDNDADSLRKLRARQVARAAINKSTRGGAVATGEGVVGLGSE